MPPSRRRARQVDEDETEGNSTHLQRDNGTGSAAEAETGDEASENEDPSRAGDEQLAKKLVRYALSCEFSRTPIRRDGIKERVLGNQGRAFRKIFALAQKQLRTIWGMELRELPVREKMTLQEKRHAMRSNAQPKTGSGAYILTSVLPAAYRSAAIVPPSRIPTVEDEAIYLAFYTMVVSLIWLSANELSDPKLKRHLQRLNADKNVASEKTELTLKRMERQGYVVRNVNRPPVGQEGDEIVTWHVGPRGREEIGLDGVMGFVREVYGGSSDDLEKKLRSSLGIKQVQEAGAEDADGDTVM
ncbi:Non-structural maintenance of chromosome element 3 [Cordyceps militaris]|uniref:Non-structural maintenance of chromosome element 3 n=1 Tax=Cordyceps militaris TaxID=73501 RepID=A0A2H4SGX0_CORMI|nr:Non-structural maintenance of chromosome element 3 [Cordyceps militaris]